MEAAAQGRTGLDPGGHGLRKAGYRWNQNPNLGALLVKHFPLSSCQRTPAAVLTDCRILTQLSGLKNTRIDIV